MDNRPESGQQPEPLRPRSPDFCPETLDRHPAATGWNRPKKSLITMQGRHQLTMKKTALLLLLFIAGCTGIPANVKPVDNFRLDRYLGRWYEIARLDHSFERGLSRVTADYSLADDGGVRVLNRGYFAAENRWKEAEGKAFFVETPEQGYLKVSFFGPFYGSYVIFELDHLGYQYALVSGPDHSYLWILARTPRLDRNILDGLVAKATAAGFDTSQLIFPSHE
jgi:apolipoprotein D and lipocalin family protein